MSTPSKFSDPVQTVIEKSELELEGGCQDSFVPKKSLIKTNKWHKVSRMLIVADKKNVGRNFVKAIQDLSKEFE